MPETQTEDHCWKVGGYPDLKQLHVVRKLPGGGASAHEWHLDSKGLVKNFEEFEDAQKVADRLNRTTKKRSES